MSSAVRSIEKSMQSELDKAHTEYAQLAHQLGSLQYDYEAKKGRLLEQMAEAHQSILKLTTKRVDVPAPASVEPAKIEE